MKIRKISLIKLWESQLYRPLYALVEIWRVGGYNNNPIELIKKGKRKMLKSVLVLIGGLGLLSTIPWIAKEALLRGSNTDPFVVPVFLLAIIAIFGSIISLYECESQNFRPARKFIRSVIALDKILLEVGRAGIASLPQDKGDIVKELHNVLVWEARLKLEAEKRDRYGEDVEKHDSRFRRLVKAISNMGFEIERWDKYYDEAKTMLDNK